MTNRECRIKDLRQHWGELLLEKEMKIREILEIEYKLNLIKERLTRYGIPKKDSRLGSNETDMGKSDDLDNCFAYNGSTSVHEL